jgi:hypothetical protein
MHEDQHLVSVNSESNQIANMRRASHELYAIRGFPCLAKRVCNDLDLLKITACVCLGDRCACIINRNEISLLVSMAVQMVLVLESQIAPHCIASSV